MVVVLVMVLVKSGVEVWSDHFRNLVFGVVGVHLDVKTET